MDQEQLLQFVTMALSHQRRPYNIYRNVSHGNDTMSLPCTSTDMQSDDREVNHLNSDAREPLATLIGLDVAGGSDSPRNGHGSVVLRSRPE